MHEVERTDWSPTERDLWRRIAAHPLEREDHALDFTKRLARDRGWSLSFARGAVAEYRRFCFLAMVFDTPVTPSEEVDEVWHQHLTYSRDYWERWCGQALGAPLHHDPTAGGPAEQSRYRAQYAETLARYEAYFGSPDPLFWPGTSRRFRARPRYRIVDADRVLLLPRPDWRGWFGRAAGALALWLAAPPPAQALPLNPLDWPGKPFLALFVGLGVATCVVAWMLRRLRMLRRGADAATDDLGLIDLAILAGGRERAADTIVVGWLETGAAQLDATRNWFGLARKTIEVDDGNVTLPVEWQPFRGQVRGTFPRSDLLKVLDSRLGGIEAALARRGLVPSVGEKRRVQMETLLLFAPAMLLGGAKLLLGLSRDRPIGFLGFAMMALAMVAMILLAKPPLRTGGGDAALAAYRRRHRRAARAPRDHELLFAFALGGAAVLAGTEHAAYAKLMQQSGGGDSGSGGGGSGCGGGCGGCGS